VTASSDNTARIWDAATGKQIAPLEGHTNWVLSAAFSPDGARIVTASFDNTARIWDAATGKQIAPLEGHTNRVLSAAFSPDGARIVTASSDNTARIWDVSRSIPMARSLAIALTAALAHGIGWRTDRERADLLMQDAEDDLFAEALKQLGRTADDREVAEAAAALRAPLHPNCYLSPTQMAARFGAAGGGERPVTDPSAASLPRAVPSGPDSSGREPRQAAPARHSPPAASPAAQRPRRRWPLRLGLSALLLAVALSAAVALGRIDIAELALRIGGVLQR
jgi:hypothetical protein